MHKALRVTMHSRFIAPLVLFRARVIFVKDVFAFRRTRETKIGVI